jgi:hypothetical protein
MVYAVTAIAFNAYVRDSYYTAAVDVLIDLFFFEAPVPSPIRALGQRT